MKKLIITLFCCVVFLIGNLAWAGPAPKKHQHYTKKQHKQHIAKQKCKSQKTIMSPMMTPSEPTPTTTHKAFEWGK